MYANARHRPTCERTSAARPLTRTGATKLRAELSSRRASAHPWSRLGALARCVLVLFVPGHLDGFQLRLIRLGLVVGEAGQFGHVPVQVGESNGQRIDL